MSLENGLPTVRGQLLRSCGILQNLAQLLLHLASAARHEMSVPARNKRSLSSHGADSNGMPQASASNTRIVGTPGSACAYARRGTCTVHLYCANSCGTRPFTIHPPYSIPGVVAQIQARNRSRIRDAAMMRVVEKQRLALVRLATSDLPNEFRIVPFVHQHDVGAVERLRVIEGIEPIQSAREFRVEFAKARNALLGLLFTQMSGSRRGGSSTGGGCITVRERDRSAARCA